MAIAVLEIVIFLFDNLREKTSVPLTNSQVLCVFKILTSHWLKIAGVMDK